MGLGINGTAGQESAEQPLSLSGPNIIGTDGNVVNFQGVNWFGFEVLTIPGHANHIGVAMLAMLSGFAAGAGRSDHAGRHVGQRECDAERPRHYPAAHPTAGFQCHPPALQHAGPLHISAKVSSQSQLPTSCSAVCVHHGCGSPGFNTAQGLHCSVCIPHEPAAAAIRHSPCSGAAQVTGGCR